MSDFEISLRDLPHQAGSLKEVDLSVPAPADLGNAMIGAKPGSPGASAGHADLHGRRRTG